MRSARPGRTATALLVALLALGGCATDPAGQRPLETARVGAAAVAGNGADPEGVGGTGLHADPEGVGGTGLHADPEGMGGTGLHPDPEGMGGTGLRADPEGMGGTGLRADPEGMGGTGLRADPEGMGGTGVVGAITGFGSIIVNQLRIELPGETPITINARPREPSDLATGQVVEVLASGPPGDLRASRVEVFDALVGRVTQVDARTGTLSVLAREIQPDARTVTPGGAGYRVGERVRVSGFPRGAAALSATRIERVGPSTPASATGQITRIEPDGFWIGALRVRADETVAAGDTVHASGLEVDGMLEARVVVVRPATPFGGRAARLVVEGVVGEVPANQALQVGRVRATLTDRTRFEGGTRARPAPGDRVVVTARVRDDGRVVAETVRADRTGSDASAPQRPAAPAPVTPAPAPSKPPAGSRGKTRSTRSTMAPASAPAPASFADGAADGSSGDDGADSGGSGSSDGSTGTSASDASSAGGTSRSGAADAAESLSRGDSISR